jgi:hypothetical protein
MLNNEFRRLFWVVVGFAIGYTGAYLLLSESPSPEPPTQEEKTIDFKKRYPAAG